MKNRISSYIIFAVIGLAVIGLLSKVIYNPVDFFKGIAIMLGIGAVVFLLFKLFYKPSPAKREQRAFIKAAKKSTKRKLQKDTSQQNRMKMKKKSNLTSIKKARALKKKHSSPQLTVIEGKKGKKKNRASFL